MKIKTTVFLGLTTLMGIACWAAEEGASVCWLSRADAWVDTQDAAGGGGQQPGAEKKPSWKSNDEYLAFQAIVNAKDPNKQIAEAEAFLQKFGATTDFKDQAYQVEMGAYQQLGDSAKAIDAAHKAVETNPGNLMALNYLSFAFPFVFKGDAPDKDSKLAQAEANAKRGLEALQKLQKPEKVPEDQFNQQVKVLRANFNGALGFVALMRKDYAAAITPLKAALEDNPNDPYITYRLGLAYLDSSPPDFDNAIWFLGRADDLAKAAKSTDAAAIDKYFGQVYVGRHGSDQGEKDVLTQAATAVNPPAGFKVTQPEKHKPTGNPAIDAFYNIEDSVRVGGDQAQQAWTQIKGQPYGFGGQVDGIDKGSDPGGTLVHIDVTDESKKKDGVYDIALRTKQPDAKYLAKGDLVRFQGTIAEYTETPSFALTLDGTINEEDLAAAAEKHKKKAAPVRHRPTHRATQ
jgi:tetratricopeptide (TPR) repeat protein